MSRASRVLAQADEIFSIPELIIGYAAGRIGRKLGREISRSQHTAYVTDPDHPLYGKAVNIKSRDHESTNVEHEGKSYTLPSEFVAPTHLDSTQIGQGY